jgi:hypothetical protein
MKEESDLESDGCYPLVKERYEYPISVPATGKTMADVIREMQVPETILETMSTYSLIQSILDNPLLKFSLVLSTSSVVGGAHVSFEQMNCIKELERRQDCANIILFYKKIDYSCICARIQESGSIEIPVRLYFFELLFTKREIADRLNPSEKRNLVSELLHKYNQKLDYPDIVSDHLKVSSFMAMAWIMHADNYAPIMNLYKKDDVFRESMNEDSFSPKHRNQILSYAESFIKE